MYRIVQRASHEFPDTTAFIATLNSLGGHPIPEARGFFDDESEIIVARAPGRLDVMGGIADYSGSLVLEMPIREATFAAVQRDPSGVLSIISLSQDAEREMVFKMPFERFGAGENLLDYQSARELFQQDPSRQWAAYVAGVFLVLMRERGFVFTDGARILIDSRVPEGKGVSSSAALEVAAMQAVVAAYGITMTPRELALHCQRVENLVVGAPCGVMDQMAAVCGEEGQLLAMRCQPAELIDSIPIPEEMAIWGLDSGERHSVSGADYGDVRVGAFMGYRIIAELSEFETHPATTEGAVRVDDPRWQGYLANMSPAAFEPFSRSLPERMSGAEFLSIYRGTTDTVARIDPERSYAVRVPTAHPIYENARVRRFAELMSAAPGEERLAALGELMYQSHSSYSACGLGSRGTDLLVDLVRNAGPRAGLYGARITGGGSGGTVAVIGRRGAGDAISKVVDQYADQTGYRPYIFSGSSPGSAAFGVLKLTDVSS